MASKLKLSIALQYGDEHVLDDRMHTLEKKFQTGCNQLVLITQKIADLEIRLDRVERRCASSSDADASGEKPSSNGGSAYGYMLRLQLSTLDGVQDVMYRYCTRLAEDLNNMYEVKSRKARTDSRS